VCINLSVRYGNKIIEEVGPSEFHGLQNDNLLWKKHIEYTE
jgi:hypothetical protein